MARSSGSISWTSDTLTPGIKHLTEDVDRRVGQLFDGMAPRVEAYARSNAKWTDRTGNARNGLRATTEHSSNLHIIWIGHSVPYGIWLEVRFEGRFAIIVPTIQNQGPEVMNALRSLLSRVA